MFHLAMPSGGRPPVAIRRATAAFLEQVTHIGIARQVEVSTRSDGENAHEWSDGLDAQQIAQRLEAHADITAVSVVCDLRCDDAAGRTLVIPDGLTFWVQLAEIDSPPDEALELNVTLDTDVYLARSWGDDRDNRELAARNAPRFNQFLADLIRETAATVESVSAEDYPAQVDASGILLPAADRPG